MHYSIRINGVELMKKVSGIGGIFFKAKNPEKIKEWYLENLGLPLSGNTIVFNWRNLNDGKQTKHTVWGPFNEDTSYFEPSGKQFMINYIVDNLEEFIAQLNDKGINIIGEIEDHEQGRFAWIIDPENNKIELWEPRKEE
jgi:lactoylglutathione lyase